MVSKPNKFQKILLFLFLGVIFLYSFNQIKESDSFYHLKAGQIIWESKSVPTTDPFSYTAPGAPWVTHEWLAEVLFYGVWNLGGFWFLMAFVALLGAITYYLLFRFALWKGANYYLTLVILFVLGGLTFELWIPRPQVFSYLFFVSILFLLEKFRHDWRPKYLLGVIPLIWLWANMHASVFLGLLLIVIYIGAEIFALIFRHYSPSGFSSRRFKWLLFALFAGVGVSVINPNGSAVLTYLFAINAGAKVLRVTEWQSILTYLYRPETKAFLAMMSVGTLLILWWHGARRGSREIAPAVIALMVFLMPIVSIRHVGYWPLAGFAFILHILTYFLDKSPIRVDEKKVWAGVFVFGIILLGARCLSFPRIYFMSDSVPVYAADFIAANNLNGPLFNLYNEGGYLIWRFFPTEKVAIDGRSEVYGPAAIKDFFGITTHADNWKELVDKKYKINYFLLAYRPDLQTRGIAPLVDTLFKEDWPLIYWDDTMVIFVRPAKENAELINKFGLRHISPFRNPESVPKEEARAIAEEVNRLLSLTPRDNIVLREWTGRFLDAQEKK